MNLTIEMDKSLLIETLEIGAAQRRRAATKFKEGSAAYSELAGQAQVLEQEANRLRSLPTPLEVAIDKTKK